MITVKQFEPIKEKMIAAGLSEAAYNKEVSFAVQMVNQNSKLRECPLGSILKAMMNIANCSLSLNPIMKQAFLETRWNRFTKSNECAMGVQYTGLADLLLNQGLITKLNTQWVYENDEFENNMADENMPIKHSRAWGNRGEKKGVYSIAYFRDGTKQPEIMTVDEINKVRERSTAYQYAIKNKKDATPWITDYDEMGRKTVLRRFYKYLPKGQGRESLDKVIDIENQDYGANHSQKMYISDLCKRANLPLEKIEQIESGLDRMTFDQAQQTIQHLKDNQVPDDPRYNGGAGSVTAMAQAANSAVEKERT